MAQNKLIISQVMMPNQTNPSGNIYGGDIMKMMDSAAYAVTRKYARCNVVTARVDELEFLSLGGLGDPRRPMHRAQIMITVRLKIDKGDHGDQFTITLDQIIAPWCASVDIRLKTRPNLGLFDRPYLFETEKDTK